MKKQLIVPMIAATVMLTGCSSGDLTSLQEEVQALKQEVAALKAQLGVTNVVTDTALVNDSSATEGNSSSTTNVSTSGVGSLGQPIVVKGVTYTITEGERTSQITDHIVASDGYEFIKYNVQINNTSNEDHSYTQASFNLVLSSGEIIDDYLIVDLYNQLDDLGTGDLASGGQKTGWILFEIPKGDQPLELRYKELTLFSTTDRGTFTVKLR